MYTDRQGHIQGDSRRYSMQDTTEAQLEDNLSDRQFNHFKYYWQTVGPLEKMARPLDTTINRQS